MPCRSTIRSTHEASNRRARPSWVVPGIGFLVAALLFVLLLVLVNAMRG